MNTTPNTTYISQPRVSHPIPIPQKEAQKQYDDDDICGSFHGHSIKCNPILVARSLAFNKQTIEKK